MADFCLQLNSQLTLVFTGDQPFNPEIVLGLGANVDVDLPIIIWLGTYIAIVQLEGVKGYKMYIWFKYDNTNMFCTPPPQVVLAVPTLNLSALPL